MSASQDSMIVSSLSKAEQVKGMIEQLQKQLQERQPGYESLLHTIHRQLAIDPDTVQVLSEQEIGIICAGLQKRTGVFLVKEDVKKSSSSKKLSVNDL